MKRFANQRGQSSIADALFFFSIASTLALFLYVFGTGYGAHLAEQTQKDQFREYVNSGLRVILYSSTPRDPTVSLDAALEVNGDSDLTNDKEIDSLLAGVKEDFADDGGLEQTADTLKNTIRSVMSPLANSVDYAFYIYVSDLSASDHFPYFLLYKSVSIPYDKTELNDSSLRVPSNPKFSQSKCYSGDSARDTILANAGGCHVFEYCDVQDLSNINDFFFSLPGLTRASTRTIFLAAPASTVGQAESQESEIHFVVWPSVKINETGAAPYNALQCCLAENPNVAELASCKTQFIGSGNASAGVRLELLPSSVELSELSEGSFETKTVNVLVKNKTDEGLSGISLDDADDFDCVPEWITVSSNPVPVISPKILVTKNQLNAQAGQGYWVRSNGVDVELTASNVSSVITEYANAPPDFQIQLFTVAQATLQVHVPNVSNLLELPNPKQCKLKLAYTKGSDSQEQFRTFTISRTSS